MFMAPRRHDKASKSREPERKETPQHARQNAGANFEVPADVPPAAEPFDPDDTVRERRHPSALEDDANDANRQRPVDDMAHGRTHGPRSGTLSSQDDADRLPIVESGLPVAPEDLGRQFLGAATEQDNFESDLRPDDVDLNGRRLGDLVSEGSRESAGQDDVEVPESSAFTGALVDELDSLPPEVDLSSDAVHEGSLLDREEEELEDGDVQEPTVVRTDDLEHFDSGGAIDEEEREREMKRARERLREGRGATRPVRQPARRTDAEVRRAARAVRASRRAAELVADAAGLDDFDSAMAALEIVCSGIVRRIEPSEARDFIAQLPSELRAYLATEAESGPERSLTRETIEIEIARHFDIEIDEASVLVKHVGIALEHLVSQGEIAHVRSQLPEDLRSIFSGEVLHRTP